ncbi:MAG: anaerobic ribonucleoside-triphosphate reductase activating protein [Candidatus Pacebacteria bacterium]|nr:anaerobic ribonucleoside-triphosphate reductase activating protein [Candidatus Paceibacterota bacterium]
MKIAALEKLTLIDYPNHLAAIIFTVSCNFRCHYCYNPMLVWPKKGSGKKDKNEKAYSLISENELFQFLKYRQGKLEGLVITGGEPTLQPDLETFIAKVKDLGYLVKLDTNGTRPEIVARLLDKKLIDYIAMDFKAPIEDYKKVVNVNLDFRKIAKSVKMIAGSKIGHEFRTTVLPQLLSPADIEKMAKYLPKNSKWYLQQFKSESDLVNMNYKKFSAYSDKDMESLVNIAKKYIKNTNWR